MPRHMTSVSIDLVIDYPENMPLDASKKEVQDFLRSEFIEYLDSAEHIDLMFSIDPEEEEE